ncbi:MAG: RNA 2',3'-cyclic phosphodiesterase [Candidatus Aminicenantes bacterium]|nr:RNA 2',3'-cyclic phosphodiesterase [Candidatus Aminicenantes bacterium]
MRTFVAIDLAPDLKINLEALIRNIKKGAKGIKWTNSAGMHLTLKFLGDIPPEKAGDVIVLLKTIAEKHSTFPLQMKGTGTFPPGRKWGTRVIWAGIAETPELMVLHEGMEEGFERIGFPREGRPFHPHMTLGRVKSPDGLEPVLDELEKYRETDFGRMMVDRIRFFESFLKPGGADHSVLAEVEFR